MVEHKHIEYDDLVIGKPKRGTTYFHVSAHGARSRWTAEERPGLTHPEITYNDRYPGTRVVLQSIYAKRYK